MTKIVLKFIKAFKKLYDKLLKIKNHTSFNVDHIKNGFDFFIGNKSIC